jgi:hypothetical protein
MKANVPIKRPGKGQEGEGQGRRVEDAGLKVTKERSAAEIIGAPVRDNSILQELAKKIFCRIKPPVNVPEEERAVGEKKWVKKKEHQRGRYSKRGVL